MYFLQFVYPFLYISDVFSCSKSRSSAMENIVWEGAVNFPFMD